MIVGGSGRKVKNRGELIYLCARCEQLVPFALVEAYNYGQLYGVRLVKYKAKRMLLCAHCERGYELSKEQWNAARILANEFTQIPEATVAGELAVATAIKVAERVFPSDAEMIRVVLTAPPEPEQVEGEPPGVIEPASGDETKVCPECAETVKAAARKCRFCGCLFNELAGGTG